MSESHPDDVAGRHPSSVPHLRRDMLRDEAVSASLAECARRLLRSESGSLSVPGGMVDSARRLALRISDDLPSMLREPTVGVSDHSISIGCSGRMTALIGGEEPAESVCWIPTGDPRGFWPPFVSIIRGLLAAGYPGCIDCAGPAASEPWDEAGQRLLLSGRSGHASSDQKQIGR